MCLHTGWAAEEGVIYQQYGDDCQYDSGVRIRFHVSEVSNTRESERTAGARHAHSPAGPIDGQAREVFAVPGPVGTRTRGTHQLLRQGAGLAESADDVLGEIAPHLRAAPASPAVNLTDLETAIVAQLDELPRSVDDLIARTGLPAGSVLETLLVLELRGVVRQLPGQCFARAGRAVRTRAAAARAASKRRVARGARGSRRWSFSRWLLGGSDEARVGRSVRALSGGSVLRRAGSLRSRSLVARTSAPRT